jgi:hypothetical protein
MRVRITKELAGSIDGIQLSRLSRGQVYDVATSLACYLLSEEMAEPALNEEPTAVLPIDSHVAERPIEARGKGLILPRSLAADRTGERSGTNRKKKES